MSAENAESVAQPIWDSHVHLLPERRSRSLVRWIKKSFPWHPSSEDCTHDDIISGLKACGVEVMFNLVFPLEEEETDPLNDFSAGLAREYDFVVPFGSMHVATPVKEEVAERCLTEKGLAGIKLHPYAQGFEGFSTDFEPLYRKLDDLQRPLIVHTGFDVFYGRSQDLSYLRSMLDRYPDMPVVLVHSLFPRFELAYELMAEHGRLYLDMTNVFSAVSWYLQAPPRALPREEIGLLRENMERFDALIGDFHNRIMFGTDHPVGMGSPEQIYSDFESFKMEPEARQDILGGTARRFLEECCGRCM